jgi:hypothetical protein
MTIIANFNCPSREILITVVMIQKDVRPYSIVPCANQPTMKWLTNTHSFHHLSPVCISVKC